MKPTLLFAPGARVVVRDAEWVIRRVDSASDGGQQLTCDGVSELVRDQAAVFLTGIDKHIQHLDPAETVLTKDTSSGYQASLLYMESLLRQVAPSDEQIHLGHRAAMDAVPYQLEPARQALGQPRQRILIADAVGLGKTLEGGILVSELIRRGKGKRILVLTVKSLLTQFQKEFWNRFTIPLTRLDSIGIQRVRNRIPTQHNPFYYYDKAIISIDTLKQDAEYRTYLEDAYWDIIVIDEAHNVADRGTRSQRSRLARLLARRSDTLIMLSATPHDGRARSFASLMNMLDATAIADPDDYVHEDFRAKGLVIRRFKKDIQDQVGQAFKDRVVYRYRHAASPAEEAAFEALLNVRTGEPGENPSRGRDLFKVGLEKALFSSPAACIQSIHERVRKRRRQQAQAGNTGYAEEIDALLYLQRLLENIGPEGYAKYQALLSTIRDKNRFNWTPNDTEDRLVIFTERIETLRFLADHLPIDLKLPPGRLAILHGGLSDIEQQAVVEAFGNPEAKVRLLVCSDVAAEGINLHYLAHRLIHFDIPWSLMVFQQRNGRIDRYGQTHTPRIVYLITESDNPTIRGDMRILEVLQEKDDQAYKNIGDPSAFMNVYDIDAEEQITAAAIAGSLDANSFDRQLTPKPDAGEDLLNLFLGHIQAEGSEAFEKPALPEAPLSLFADDFAYCHAALRYLNSERMQVSFSADPARRRLSLTAPDDLRHRFSFMPREIIPAHWQFILSPDKALIDEEIKRSRGDEAPWPKVHYLWPLNPVVEWLNDRMLAAFGRHQAPVIRCPQGLSAGESVFVISGLIPNRKSHPLVYEWLGVVFHGEQFSHIEPFQETHQRTQLGARPLPNRGQPEDTATLKRLLPVAVAHARARLIECCEAFEAQTQARLNRQLAELERLKTRQVQQLALQLERSAQPEAIKQARQQQRQREIDATFDDYSRWVEDTLTAERQPYLQVICVLRGTE